MTRHNLLALLFAGLALTGPLPSVSATPVETAPAPAPREGYEYTEILGQPVETGAKIEVREMFWYRCPHCYQAEPDIEKWRKTLPKNVKFIRTPAVFNPNWEVHARAYYAFEALKVVDKLHGPLFKALHAENRQLLDAASLAQFVGEQGVDRQKFLAAMDSFSVNMKVKAAQQMGLNYRITGVPAIVVDGKFVTSAQQAGTRDKLMPIVDYLIKQAVAERKANGGKP